MLEDNVFNMMQMHEDELTEIYSALKMLRLVPEDARAKALEVIATLQFRADMEQYEGIYQMLKDNQLMMAPETQKKIYFIISLMDSIKAELSCQNFLDSPSKTLH